MCGVYACRAEAQAAAKKLLQLEKERDKYSVEAGEANARYLEVGALKKDHACNGAVTL